MALRAPRTDRGLGRPRQRPPDKAAAALGRAKEGAVPRQGALPRLGSARSQDGGCVARSRVEAPPGRASALLRSRDAPFRPSGGYGGAAGTSGALVRPVGGLLAAPVSARGRVPQRLRGLGRGSSWGLRPPSPGLWLLVFFVRMSGPTFPSPAAEMAEINRLQYEMEYTEGISQRMRVPEKLKVAPPTASLEQSIQEGLPNASVTMQVPERIVVAGNSEDIPFSRPPDLDLLQSTPFKPLALKTPPRVISLSERPLDFLDLEKPPPQTPQNEEVRSVGRLKRERSMSENAARQNGQLVRNDSIVTPSLQQARVCPPNMLPEDGTNLYSARGILSLIQTSTRRAYQQVLDVLDENRRPVLRGGSSATTSSNPHHDNTRSGLSNLDVTIEGTPDDMTVVDAASLRRQVATQMRVEGAMPAAPHTKDKLRHVLGAPMPSCRHHFHTPLPAADHNKKR
ncbi:mitochondrial fission factor isoform X4 [Alligator mississippiensis]|uniref:mitochondrial fission factor isoform X4 n=1 Tax=Alligator mississippiensis TaxID=8496 RepID=UPI0009076A07|nr:mitochondrial fission factor isoform X4 [Alligator mississippiensis]